MRTPSRASLQANPDDGPARVAALGSAPLRRAHLERQRARAISPDAQPPSLQPRTDPRRSHHRGYGSRIERQHFRTRGGTGQASEATQDLRSARRMAMERTGRGSAGAAGIRLAATREHWRSQAAAATLTARVSRDPGPRWTRLYRGRRSARCLARPSTVDTEVDTSAWAAFARLHSHSHAATGLLLKVGKATGVLLVKTGTVRRLGQAAARAAIRDRNKRRLFRRSRLFATLRPG